MKLEGDIDWSLATWEGSRREMLRRWARLPLGRVIAALEEMQELKETLSELAISGTDIKEPQGNHCVKNRNDSERQDRSSPLSAQGL